MSAWQPPDFEKRSDTQPPTMTTPLLSPTMNSTRKASVARLLCALHADSPTEQEKLIHDFQSEEARLNERYRLIFSILPLTVVLPFMFYLSFASRSVTVFLCIMAMTSLISTAYTMWYIPFSPPPRPPTGRKGRHRGGNTLGFLTEEKGPIDRFLPYLNPIISVMLCVAAWPLKYQERGPEGLWMFLLMPGVLLLMITIVRRSMVDVQTGIGALSGMKYNYRGA